MDNGVLNQHLTIGVLALQGAFNEHKQLLRRASHILSAKHEFQHISWTFLEIRTDSELSKCSALIIPGGESTAISLVAQRSNLLEPLRDFVKVQRKPTWGTCAGLILLSESANRTKQGGQELIGGLDVRVNRNHFGRQIESFQADLDLPFLTSPNPFPSPSTEELNTSQPPFQAIFIRAPIVEKLLPTAPGIQKEEAARGQDTVVAPSRALADGLDVKKIRDARVEVLARLPGRTAALRPEAKELLDVEAGDIVAVRQANVFGTSFHPELSGDPRIHVWWLREVLAAVGEAGEE